MKTKGWIKDKKGNRLTTREFLTRWKEGIQNLTPVQRLTNEARGNAISFVGLLVALVALIIYRDKLIVSWFAYGLILVFLGNAWTTGIKWLGLRQQLKLFKTIDEQATNIEEYLDESEGRSKWE